MNRSMRKLSLLAAISVVGLLTLGAATASAHGGGGCKGAGGVSASSLVTKAATQLNVTRAKLKSAIVDAADARIDAEVAAGDIESDEAADLKDRADDDLAFAIKTSQTRTVAANLGITVAALNDGFRSARKALYTAKIDKALASGDITAAEAADLKAELDDADLPGYKAFASGGFDLGYGGGSHSGGDCRGFHR
jgi:hypothetical protein